MSFSLGLYIYIYIFIFFFLQRVRLGLCSLDCSPYSSGGNRRSAKGCKGDHKLENMGICQILKWCKSEFFS